VSLLQPHCGSTPQTLLGGDVVQLPPPVSGLLPPESWPGPESKPGRMLESLVLPPSVPGVMIVSSIGLTE
jgi:hypothetical protein